MKWIASGHEGDHARGVVLERAEMIAQEWLTDPCRARREASRQR